MRNFDNEDKIKLLSLVKCRRLANKPLKFCFEEYAETCGKSVGSVKNFYYRIMSDKSGARKLCERLGISEKLMPIAIKEFSLLEKEELLNGILTGLSEGKSVRNRAFELSKGNVKLALRYQNKYYSLLKEDRPLVMKTALTILNKTGKSVNPYSKFFPYAIREKEVEKVRETADLLKRIKMLEDENIKLKRIVKQNLKEKNFTPILSF